MQKFLLTVAVTTLSISSSQAAPEIYGKAFVTTDYVDRQSNYARSSNNSGLSDKQSLQVNSYFSRLGFRGSEAITEDTDIIYQLEYGVQIDGNNDSIALSSRDTYLGLTNPKYGELRIGRNLSLLNYIYGPMVNKGYWDNLGNTQLGSNKLVSALNMVDYTRADNSIVWFTPKHNGFQLRAQYVADEGSTSDNNQGYGASLSFEQSNGVSLGFVYSKDIEVSGSINTLNDNNNSSDSVNYSGNVVRGTVNIDLDKYLDTSLPLTLGALYQQADYKFADSDKEKGIVLSASIKINKLQRPSSIYLQYNNTDNLNGVGNNQSEQLVLGGDYEFKDNIIAHAYIGQNSADYTDPMDISDSVSDIKVIAVGGGLEYLF